MLHGENLRLTYQDGDTTIDAVHDVSLTIGERQFIGILGPSGSGKSSLLYLLSGLRKPTGGEICLDDRAYGKMSDKERVAIARAMIHRPRIIFADEPTGLLDRHTGLQVMALLRGYRDQGSLIAVTHNPEILTEADLAVTMRDGQIVKIEDSVARKTQEERA